MSIYQSRRGTKKHRGRALVAAGNSWGGLQIPRTTEMHYGPLSPSPSQLNNKLCSYNKGGAQEGIAGI